MKKVDPIIVKKSSFIDSDLVKKPYKLTKSADRVKKSMDKINSLLNAFIVKKVTPVKKRRLIMVLCIIKLIYQYPLLYEMKI